MSHTLTMLKGPPFRTSDAKGPLFLHPKHPKKEAAIYPSKKPITLDDDTYERLMRNHDFVWWFKNGCFLVDGKPHPEAGHVKVPDFIPKPKAYVRGHPEKHPDPEQGVAAGLEPEPEPEEPAADFSDLRGLDAKGLKAMHHARAAKLIAACDDAELLNTLMGYGDLRASVHQALESRLSELTAP